MSLYNSLPINKSINHCDRPLLDSSSVIKIFLKIMLFVCKTHIIKHNTLILYKSYAVHMSTVHYNSIFIIGNGTIILQKHFLSVAVLARVTFSYNKKLRFLLLYTSSNNKKNKILKKYLPQLNKSDRDVMWIRRLISMNCTFVFLVNFKITKFDKYRLNSSSNSFIFY